MQNMLDRAMDLAVAHVEAEIGLQPKTFARENRSVFGKIDSSLTDYANTRAFWITGIAKQEILDTVKGMITEWSRTHLEPYPDLQLVTDIEKALSGYLPQGTNVASRAQTIARTNISDIYNHTRVQVLTAPQLSNFITAFMYSAILDGRTTAICRSLAGRIFTKDEVAKWTPPNHFNCRSVILPITVKDVGWEQAYLAQPPLPEDLTPQEGF